LRRLREIAAEAYGEVGTMARVTLDGGHDDTPVLSENESADSSEGDSGGSAGDDASGDKISQTYCFGTSIITLGQIWEMVEKGYFAGGGGGSTGYERGNNTGSTGG
jgi:hypothetical protein